MSCRVKQFVSSSMLNVLGGFFFLTWDTKINLLLHLPPSTPWQYFYNVWNLIPTKTPLVWPMTHSQLIHNRAAAPVIFSLDLHISGETALQKPIHPQGNCPHRPAQVETLHCSLSPATRDIFPLSLQQWFSSGSGDLGSHPHHSANQVQLSKRYVSGM